MTALTPTSQAESSATVGSSAPAREHRLGTVAGDRTCIQCGFNLYGQPILREPHYGLIIARCSECGAAAPFQEYPLLGRWANRIAGLLAAIYLAAILALLIASTLRTAAYVDSISHTVVRPTALVIAKEYIAHMRAATAAVITDGQTNTWESIQPTEYQWIDQTWLSTQSPEAIMQRARAAGPLLDWSGSRGWLLMALSLICWGMVWSIALLHIRRARVWIAAIPIVLLSWFLSYPSLWPSYTWGWGGKYAVQVAVDWMGSSVRWPTYCIATLSLALGLWIGRPVARLAVRFFLPPRLRVPLSFLWTADGRTPPRASPA